MVIFLDIDGVLNDRKFRLSGLQRGHYSVLIDPTKVVLLKRIVEATGAKLVLSSSWKKFWDRPAADGAGRRIDAALGEFGLEIMTKIPWVREATRSEEIEAWLKMYPHVINFVILDDNDHAWTRGLRAHWVQTDSTVGLDEETVSQAIAVLRGDLIPVPKESLWKRIERMFKR